MSGVAKTYSADSDWMIRIRHPNEHDDRIHVEVLVPPDAPEEIQHEIGEALAKLTAWRMGMEYTAMGGLAGWLETLEGDDPANAAGQP